MTAMGEDAAARLFSNRWADAVGPRGTGPDRDRCSCFDQGEVQPHRTERFHAERQDTEAPGWASVHGWLLSPGGPTPSELEPNRIL